MRDKRTAKDVCGEATGYVDYYSLVIFALPSYDRWFKMPLIFIPFIYWNLCGKNRLWAVRLVFWGFTKKAFPVNKVSPN